MFDKNGSNQSTSSNGEENGGQTAAGGIYHNVIDAAGGRHWLACSRLRSKGWGKVPPRYGADYEGEGEQQESDKPPTLTTTPCR